MMNENTKQKKSGFLDMVKAFKKYYASFAIAIILLIISIIATILIPGNIRELTNAISPTTVKSSGAIFNVDFYTVSSLGIKLTILILVVFLCGLLANLVLNVVIQKFTMDLRGQISHKINRMPLDFFDNKAIGDILSVITNDIDTLATTLQNCVNILINSVLMLIGVIIAMFVTCWQLAIVVVISLPLMAIVLMSTFKIAIPLFNKNQETLALLNSKIEENYSGQLVIKAFNAQNRKQEEFKETNSILSKVWFKSQAIGNMVEPFMSLISYFTYAAILIVGGLLYADKTIDIGIITGFIVYVVLFQTPLAEIGQVSSALQLGIAACNRVFSFLSEKEIPKERVKKRKFNGKSIIGEVEFKDVCFGYDPSHLTIKNFSEKIKPGSKVAIIGPTGAGKTTLVNLLMRFYDITSGDILVDGVSINEIPIKELREIFGMILQETWVINGTLRENIVYNIENVFEGRINKVLEETNLAHFVNTLPDGLDTVIQKESALSAGQKQLITIARAMLENAPILILDEATSNVDTRTEIQIQNAMDKLTKDRTSFVIAHRLSTIKNADLIIVMKDGNVVETGTHSTLMEKGGLYSELYNAQFS